MQRLTGRVALVIGATRGVGEAIARRFAAEGTAVVLVGRTVERGERVAADIEQAGGRASFVHGDVGVESDVEGSVRHAVDRFGALHILVNNAIPTDQMAANMKPLHEYSLEEFEGILRVALSGTFLNIKHSVPRMLAAGTGSIVNISTMASIMANFAVTQVPAIKAAIEDQHLVPQLGENDDVAALAAYLASDEARFVTGAQFIADGGFSVRTSSIKEMAEASFGA